MTKEQIDKEFDEELMEQLADIEHQRWADWQKYLHSKTKPYDDYLDYGDMIIDVDDFNHWEDQIKTPYKDLTEKEKQSDRNQVARYSPIIKQFIHNQIEKAIDEEKKQ